MNDTGGADKAIAVLEHNTTNHSSSPTARFQSHMPWYVPQKYFDMLHPLDQIVLPDLKEDELG
ncbi:MAG: hypothetical protein R3F11_12455 [Verrucomicrobiales bacterium]